MPDNNDLTVGGYHFHSQADADKARDEQKKIAVLTSSGQMAAWRFSYSSSQPGLRNILNANLRVIVLVVFS